MANGSSRTTDSAARRGHGLRRLAVAAAIFAAVVGVALAANAPVGVAVAGAWGAAALVIVLLVWLRVGRWDAAQTAAHALAEDFSRAAADGILVSASVSSLVPVGFVIVSAGRHHAADKLLLVLLAIAAISFSWALVHTVYALRYGDLYYAEPAGGINFHETDPPDYRDFAYVALTIGMTYQVADTDVGAKAIRRTATRHALVSYLFGAVIVAVLINSVASLLH